MLFIAIMIAALIVYLVQMRIYGKHTFESLKYDVSVSAEEVFEGEDIFLYEELVNDKALPVSAVKISTELPAGLSFRLSDKTNSKNKKDVFERYIQSAFVLKGYQMIKRRWRVSCNTRGVYKLGHVLMVSNDLFGFNAVSQSFDAPRSRYNQVVVLPRAIELEKHFTASRYHSGEVTVLRSLLSDPLLRAGSREYLPNDPMSKINWKSTALHGKLMVNVEEYTEQYQFNLILNMQSRKVELHPREPSSPEFIELCITVCASILDGVAGENIPVKIFANTPPESIGMEAVSDDETGRQMLVTKAFRGKQDILNALRLLAQLEMKISCPADKMLDHISESPNYYAGSGNIIIVSSYIDERMIVFHDNMERQGIKVMFYVVTANQNAVIVPPNVEVYYKTYLGEGEVR